MKKAIIVSLTIIMLAATTAAYAAKSGQNESGSAKETPKLVRQAEVKETNNGNANAKLTGQQRKDEVEKKKAELQQRKTAIVRNRAEINQLRLEVKNKTKIAKSKLKELNGTMITEEKLASIREKLTLIRRDNSQLGKTLGEIEKETEKIKLQKQTHNTEGAINNFDNICAVQEQRIDALKKLNSDLDALLEVLK